MLGNKRFRGMLANCAFLGAVVVVLQPLFFNVDFKQQFNFSCYFFVVPLIAMKYF